MQNYLIPPQEKLHEAAADLMLEVLQGLVINGNNEEVEVDIRVTLFF